jgi:hypothetical protein
MTTRVSIFEKEMEKFGWSREDATAAATERWYLSWLLGTIRGCGSTENNNRDAAAREHVKRRADEGSEFHQRALRIAIMMQMMDGET